MRYKVQYRVAGTGITMEELVSARSNFEAEQIVKSRYEPGKVYIVQIVKVD